MLNRIVPILLCYLLLHSTSAFADIPELMQTAYEKCYLGDKSVKSACACHVGVLAEAKLSETEWKTIAETMKYMGRPTPRPDVYYGRCRPGEQPSDTISQSIARYVRSQCKGAIPRNQPEEWEILEAANDFLLADCSNFAQLVRGNVAAGRLALFGGRFRRRGGACDIIVPGASGPLRYKFQLFKRQGCHAHTSGTYECSGTILLSCDLDGDPVRGGIICQALQAPLATRLEISFETATCRWRVTTLNGLPRK